MEKFEPTIVAFCCHYCAYTAADMAGSMRLDYPPNVKIVRVPCSGKVDAIHIMKALEKGADLVFEMDSDFSHDPADLQAFITAIRDADLVIGSRYVDGVRVLGWRFRRLFVSKMANILVSHIMINPKIYDYTAGYRCYRRKVIASIDLDKIRSDGYAFQIEMAFNTYHKGFKIVEIPIVFKERLSGESKISRNVVWEAFWLIVRLRAPMREIIKTLALNYRKYLFID